MKDRYESPLCARYASERMQRLFSPDRRFQTWRRLWTELARAEHALGLPVTQAQVDELAAHIEQIDYSVVPIRQLIAVQLESGMAVAQLIARR